MLLLRQVIGSNLRAHREDQRRSLRDVSGAARVSLGYLSEIERGRKEASSELLASICRALDLTLADLLSAASTDLRGQDLVDRAAAVRRERLSGPAAVGSVPAEDGAAQPEPATEPAPAAATTSAARPATSLVRGSVDPTDLIYADLEHVVTGGFDALLRDLTPVVSAA